MFVGLLSSSADPFIFGAIMALTILLQIWRFRRGEYLHIAIIALSYYLMLATHATRNGQVLMGMSIAILILEFTLPLFFPRRK
jgi:hypothetical protein